MLDVQTLTGYNVKDGAGGGCPATAETPLTPSPPRAENAGGFFWAWQPHISRPSPSCHCNLSTTTPPCPPITGLLYHHTHTHTRIGTSVCVPAPAQCVLPPPPPHPVPEHTLIHMFPLFPLENNTPSVTAVGATNETPHSK